MPPVEVQTIQPGDTEQIRREKTNANFQLLLTRSFEDIIAQINSSPEAAKISKSKLADLNITDSDIQGQLSWSKINKTGSSINDLSSRSASHINEGTLGDDRLSGNIPKLSALNQFLLDMVIGANTAIATNSIIRLLVSNAGNKPGLRYLGTGTGTGKWQFSNDGNTWQDIGTPTGNGLTSLNGQTGSSQTFANDTNVKITSTGNVHTLGWDGQLPIGRGGTGAGTPADARAALAVPGLATPNAFAAMQAWAKGADIPSQAALNPGTDGNYFVVTGSTGITSIAALPAGTVIVLKFSASLALTHSANLQLLQGQNYSTEANDVIVFISEGSGVWREVSRIPGSSFRPTGPVRLDVFTNARLVLPVGADKWAA
jgi:hypothetical protein